MDERITELPEYCGARKFVVNVSSVEEASPLVHQAAQREGCRIYAIYYTTEGEKIHATVILKKV